MAKGFQAGTINTTLKVGFDKAAMNNAVKDVERNMQLMSSRVNQAGNAVQKLTAGSVLGLGGALGAAFAIGARAAVVFEQQFADVKKTLDVAGDAEQVERAFDNIAKQLRNIAKSSPAAVSELTQIAAVGGQLGIQAEEIVKFTDTIQKLTVATNLSAEQAALSLARLQKITNLTANEIDNLASVVVKLGNNFATTESEIITAATQIATATAGLQTSFNQPAVDALAFATALRAVGQPAQAGSTAIIRLIQVLDRLVDTGGSQLELVAKTAGVTAQAFQELFEIDPSMAVANFIEGLGDAESRGEDAIAVLEKLGLDQIRSRRAYMALARARADDAANTGLVTQALQMANQEFIENNALTTEAERRYETVASQVQILRNRLNETALVYGEKFLPATNAIVQAFLNISSASDDALGGLQKLTMTLAAFGTAAIVPVGATRAFKILTKDTLEYTAALNMARTGVSGLTAEQTKLMFTPTTKVRDRLLLAQNPLQGFMRGPRTVAGTSFKGLQDLIGKQNMGGVEKIGRGMQIFNKNTQQSILNLRKLAQAQNMTVLQFLRANGVFGETGNFLNKIDGAVKKYNATNKVAIRGTQGFTATLIGLNAAAKSVTIALAGVVATLGKIAITIGAFTAVFKIIDRIGQKNRAMEEFSNGLVNIGEGVNELEKANADLDQLKIMREDLIEKGATEDTIRSIDNYIDNLGQTIRGKKAIINKEAGGLLEGLVMANEPKIENQFKNTARVLGMNVEIFKDTFFAGMSDIVTDIHTGDIPNIGDFVEAFIESDFGDYEVNNALRRIQEEVGLIDFMQAVFPSGTGDIFDKGGPLARMEFELRESLRNYRGKDTEKLYEEFFNKSDEAVGRLSRDLFGGLGDTIYSQLVSDLSEQELLELLEILNAFGDTLEVISNTKLEDLTDEQMFEQASVLMQAKAAYLNQQQDLLVNAGKLAQADFIDATDMANFSKAQSQLSKILKDEFGKAADAQDRLKSDLGITDEMLMGISETIDNVLEQSIQNAINGFERLPESARITAQMFVKNLTENLKIQNEFEEVVRELSLFAPLLAKQLAEQGPRTTALAKEFLERPFLAALAEGEMLQAVGPELQQQAMASIQEALDSGELGESGQLGIDLAEGVVVGIESRKEDIEDIFTDTMIEAVKAAKKAILSSSPSMLTFNQIGVPMIDGVIAGIKSKKKELEDTFTDTLTDIFLRGEVIDELTSDFRIFQDLVSAERGITSAKGNRIRTEQALNAALRSQASLTDRIAESNKKLARLEIEGAAGVITLDEEIDLLRRKIDLTNKIEAAEGKKSARELLAIQKAEENIEDLRAMAAKGVISNLELQAAEEELSSLRGDDVSDDERKLMIAELAVTERDLNRAKEDALAIDKELVSVREENIRLKDEQALIDNTVKQAIEAVAAAKEREVEADLKLEKARNTFAEEMASGTLINSLGLIAGEYDSIKTSIDGVVAANQNINELITPLTNVIVAAATAKALIDSIDGTYDFTSSPSEGGGFTIPNPDDLGVPNTYFPRNPNLIPSAPPNSYFPRGEAGGGSTLSIDGKSLMRRILEALASLDNYGIGNYAMGGRVKKYAYGGRGDPMTRALVGEYGPEEVKFIPGNGFMVKPLGTGKAGTVVNNLNVNVTGVPSDPISARKAAVQISKALRKLDKEGSAGTGLRRN